jgi:hypothetical protein
MGNLLSFWEWIRWIEKRLAGFCEGRTGENEGRSLKAECRSETKFGMDGGEES